jgi:hypothetical protein
MDKDIAVILEAEKLIGKTVTKITGKKEYTINKSITIHNEKGGHQIIEEKGTVFLLSNDGNLNISAISSNKKLLWTTSYKELQEFLQFQENED